MTARILTVCLLALATAACGTPSRDDDDDGQTDAGTLVDAGNDVDAGEADAGEADAGDVDGGEADAGDVDGGEADAGEEPCLEGACSVDVSGDYSICAACPAPVGAQGPFAVNIHTICGCDFEACQNGTNCQVLELDTSVTPPVLTLNVALSLGGFPVNGTCTGPFEDGQAAVTCTASGFQCPGQLLLGTLTTCPTIAP